ncbi:MAG: 3-deoxy-8-phosphooctulonate synthase [Candidatus Kapabacteria bacterium]|nr:3-deoxy-8-phosphooctulonate synthase [Candidatus Kapabacteria bacterium]
MQNLTSRPIIIAGPCLVESRDLVMKVADHLAEVCRDLPVDLVLKGSYRKANRTSAGSFQGIGDEDALTYLREAGTAIGVPVLTDVHSESEVSMAAGFADILQIPAFLSRQTSLLEAAGRTNRTVNIKKGQFMAPDDMAKAAQKVVSVGNRNVWLTERGTTFGYHDLVVDFRSLVTMRQSGFPVIFDVTHSVQQPSIGAQSGGKREFIPALARAAAAVGIQGLFFETHPDPSSAMSDAATQLPLLDVRDFLSMVLDHWHG